MTESEFNTVIETVAEGKSTAEGLRKVGRSFGSFYDLLDDKANSEKYARAKVCSAEASESRIKDVLAKVESGELDPNAARVILDGLKWTMAKQNPRTYGDKQAIEHSGNVKLSLLDEIRNGNAD